MEKVLTLEDKLLTIVCNLGIACLFVGMFFLGMMLSLGKSALLLSAGFCLVGVLLVAYSVYMDSRKAVSNAR